MMIRWMATAAVVVAGLATPAQQLAAQAAPLAGSWLLDAERSQTVQEAVVAARGGAAGGMAMRGGAAGERAGSGNMVIRGGGPGSSGIMAALQGGQRLRIELAADHATLQLDDSAPVAAPLDGSAATVTRWDQQVQIRATLSGDTLTVETTMPNDVVVTEVLVATADGELSAELHVPLPMMGRQGEQQPVTIRRVYTAAR